LIRKDERTLFNKSTDGLYVAAPKLAQEIEEAFTEELGAEIQQKLLERWPFDEEDASWSSIKQIFRESRLRILYASEESHEWVLYTNIGTPGYAQSVSTPTSATSMGGSVGSLNIANDIGNYTLSGNIDLAVGMLSNGDILMEGDQDADDEHRHHDLQCLGGVYQKFNFEFGDGKFHDIVSMGSTRNMGWSVRDSSCFDPQVLCTVGSILNLQRKINSKYDLILPAEIWHIILGFGIDCFQPITQMREIDIVLRDVRRWTQNLYLSENLRHRDEFGDLRIRKLGQLFIEIGGLIDGEYIKYRKQFSFRKKLVRFMKNKFGQITNETSQKLKSLKASKSEQDIHDQRGGGGGRGHHESDHGNGNGNSNGNGSSNGNGDEVKSKRKRRHKHGHRHRSKSRRRKHKKHRDRSQRTKKRKSVSHHGTPTNHTRARTVDIKSIASLELNQSLPALMPNRSN